MNWVAANQDLVAVEEWGRWALFLEQMMRFITNTRSRHQQLTSTRCLRNFVVRFFVYCCFYKPIEVLFIWSENVDTLFIFFRNKAFICVLFLILFVNC